MWFIYIYDVYDLIKKNVRYKLYLNFIDGFFYKVNLNIVRWMFFFLVYEKSEKVIYV